MIGLQLEKVPEKLDCLSTLEVILTANRLIFKKILIMSKEQTPKIHVSIANVSVNVSETCTQIPREESCAELILLDLKKKFSLTGHIYFEPVRPHKVRAAWEYLQGLNLFYYVFLAEMVTLTRIY